MPYLGCTHTPHPPTWHPAYQTRRPTPCPAPAPIPIKPTHSPLSLAHVNSRDNMQHSELALGRGEVCRCRTKAASLVLLHCCHLAQVNGWLRPLGLRPATITKSGNYVRWPATRTCCLLPQEHAADLLCPARQGAQPCNPQFHTMHTSVCTWPMISPC